MAARPPEPLGPAPLGPAPPASALRAGCRKGRMSEQPCRLESIQDCNMQAEVQAKGLPAQPHGCASNGCTAHSLEIAKGVHHVLRHRVGGAAGRRGAVHLQHSGGCAPRKCGLGGGRSPLQAAAGGAAAARPARWRIALMHGAHARRQARPARHKACKATSRGRSASPRRRTGAPSCRRAAGRAPAGTGRAWGRRW